MSLEQKINYQLNKFPLVKKVVKRIYQRIMYTLSPKIKSEGNNIIRISPNDPNHEYFFGYYDKSPWDITDRYMLCMRANDTWSDPSPKEKADILLIDTSRPEEDKDRLKKIAETSSWNVQQGCMLQWLGPDFSSHIIYNDCRAGKYVSVILELATGSEKIIPAPIYTVSTDGKTALTLDFSRLYNLRPGYGYYNVPEKTKGIALPDATAVWKIDLETGAVQPLLSYKDFATFQPRPEMQEKGAIHKVNHLMLSPNGKRCMVLYRWFVGQRKYTRLITFDTETGENMYLLSDDDMVSHCCWKDAETILAFENKRNSGSGYYLMKDKTQEYIHCWPQLSNDGHPSYSPNRSLIVTDTYPNRNRIAEIKLMDGANEQKNDVKIIARIFAPFKYDNDTRCDLHPRWNYASNKICFDSVFEGSRGLYVTQISKNEKNFFLKKDIYGIDSVRNLTATISVIIPIYNVDKYLKRCVKSVIEQTYKNLEIILVDDGSYDNCPSICDELEQQDNRIIVIHKDNGGLSSARNAGLEKATGEYISFVDSDDWLSKDIYCKCIDVFNLTDSDVVDFKTTFITNEKTNNDECDEIALTTKQCEDILFDYLYRGQMEQCPFSVCRKVYKT